MVIAILLEFRENRLYLRTIELANLACEGVDLICRAFDYKGNDVDPPIADGDTLPSENDVRVIGQERVNPWNSPFTCQKNYNGSQSLFYRTSPLDQNQN
jgi:hypothetical protein